MVPRAARIDQRNFHEGMYDLYDASGTLLKQIDMHLKLTWETVDEPPSTPSANPVVNNTEEQYE
ncbi:MAG: hypothetical protein QOJ64_4143 [Acidobacteriota bacterium]|nr:hypothetical protein [Acidobacteriota bacterium]